MDCGKKLGILGGYCHPVMGKNYLLCSSCFDTTYESVEKWSKFISPYIGFFKNKSSDKDLRFDITDASEQLVHVVKMFENIWTGKGI